MLVTHTTPFHCSPTPFSNFTTWNIGLVCSLRPVLCIKKFIIRWWVGGTGRAHLAYIVWSTEFLLTLVFIFKYPLFDLNGIRYSLCVHVMMYFIFDAAHSGFGDYLPSPNHLLLVKIGISARLSKPREIWSVIQAICRPWKPGRLIHPPLPPPQPPAAGKSTDFHLKPVLNWVNFCLGYLLNLKKVWRT